MVETPDGGQLCPLTLCMLGYVHIALLLKLGVYVGTIPLFSVSSAKYLLAAEASLTSVLEAPFHQKYGYIEQGDALSCPV